METIEPMETIERGQTMPSAATTMPLTPEELADAGDGVHGPLEPPTPSVASVSGHPLHPMLVPLPIGALTLALASDLAFAATRDRFFARASQVLVATGIVSGALAGSLGLTDFAGRARIRSHGSAWLHGAGNAAALGLSLVSLAIRRQRRDAPLPAGLALSIATASILLVTGWLGGELSYRHRIGVTTD